MFNIIQKQPFSKTYICKDCGKEYKPTLPFFVIKCPKCRSKKAKEKLDLRMW